jgi:hypothetical protein
MGGLSASQVVSGTVEQRGRLLKIPTSVAVFMGGKMPTRGEHALICPKSNELRPILRRGLDVLPPFVEVFVLRHTEAFEPVGSQDAGA